jgi:hypothetical protein
MPASIYYKVLIMRRPENWNGFSFGIYRRKDNRFSIREKKEAAIQTASVGGLQDS